MWSFTVYIIREYQTNYSFHTKVSEEIITDSCTASLFDKMCTYCTHILRGAILHLHNFLFYENNLTESFVTQAKYTCLHIHLSICYQKQNTYRQGHGHDHVSTIHGWNVEDTGTCMRIYPLNRTGWLAHASWCATQGWCECPNRVSHQHGWVGLDCNERRWHGNTSKCKWFLTLMWWHIDSRQHRSQRAYPIIHSLEIFGNTLYDSIREGDKI